MNKGRGNFRTLAEENPKISRIRYSKRVKAMTIRSVDHTTLEVETLKKEEELRKMTKVVCNIF